MTPKPGGRGTSGLVLRSSNCVSAEVPDVGDNDYFPGGLLGQADDRLAPLSLLSSSPQAVNNFVDDDPEARNPR